MTAPSIKALELARRHVWTHREADGRTVMHVCNGSGPMWSVVFDVGADEQNIRENVEHRVDEVARLIQVGLDAAPVEPRAAATSVVQSAEHGGLWLVRVAKPRGRPLYLTLKYWNACAVTFEPTDALHFRSLDFAAGMVEEVKKQHPGTDAGVEEA